MVKVYFELPEDEIISTARYFNNSYTDEWLDGWAKRVIYEVDRSNLISPGLVDSPSYGNRGRRLRIRILFRSSMETK